MTFAQEAKNISTENLEAKLRNCRRGMETATDMGQWLQLAGRAQAYEAELQERSES